MRRPLLYGAVFVVLAILIRDLCGRVFLLAAGLGLAYLFRLAREQEKRRAAAVCLAFYCLGTASAFSCDIAEAQGGPTYGSEQSIEGLVLTSDPGSVEERRPAKYVVRVRGRPWLRSPKVLVTTQDRGLGLVPGDAVSVTGTPVHADGRRNPGCFDYRRYLASKGIRAVMTSPSVEVTRKGSGLRTRLHGCRTGFIEALAAETDEETAGMIAGILFGDKRGVDEDVLTEFQKNGTAHLLAVSGIHVGILYAFLNFLWPWRRGRLHFAAVGGLLLCYCLMADCSPSVVRASFMVIMHMFCRMTDRRYDLGSAGFAIIMIYVMSNPMCLYDPSLQMSFIAVMTMSLMIPYVKRFHDGVLTGSIAVQLGLMPYIAWNFNVFPLGAFLINIPMIAFTGVIVPAALVCLAMHAAFGGIGPLGGFLGAMTDLLVGLNSFSCVDGLTTFRCKSPPSFLVAAAYLFMLVFLSENGRLLLIRHGRRALAWGSILILAASSLFWGCTRSGLEGSDVVFVDVGQGDCMHMRIDDSTGLFRHREAYHVLIDGGGKEGFDIGEKTLRPYLLKNGVKRIDLALVTHLHKDHYDGIRSLCRMGMVEKLCVYEGYRVREAEIMEQCGIGREDILYVTAGDTITLGDAAFTFLAPPAHSLREYESLAEDEEDENRRSLLIKAEYRGVTAMMTGDIGMEGEEDAMEAGGGMDCDILKVGHHGSRYSTGDGFLDAVSPDVAVIQVGRNSYGHPTPETLEKLAGRGIAVYRNDRQGAVGIRIGKGKIERIATMCRE